METDVIVDLLAELVQLGGSDLHLSAGKPPTARIRGRLAPLREETLTGMQTRALVLGVLSDRQRAELEEEKELDFAFEVDEIARFRGAAYFVMGQIEANFRVVPEVTLSLDELGHSPEVARFVEMRSGLVLITGASGTGKSTSWAAMIQQIAASRATSIVTIEDPVEFLLQSGQSLVRQRQVGSDVDSFSDGLTTALRQDSDVIGIGELREPESISLAVTAAETGHLVIASMHASNIETAISRMVEAYPAEQQRFAAAQLAGCLQGVICQFLIPRSNGEGLVLASELLMANSAVRSCIRDYRLSQIRSCIEIGGNDGMHTIDDSLLQWVLSEEVLLSDAQPFARDPEGLQTSFQEAIQATKKKKGWFS